MALQSLPNLPPEVLLRIIECCQPPVLKSLRQSCKSIQVLVEPHLYNKVVAYPHLRRLEQVLNISAHPRLRHLVKSFIYDNRWFTLPDLIIKKIKSTYSARVSFEQKASMIAQVRDFKKSTLEPGRDEDIELLLLNDILRSLSDIEHIDCIENNDLWQGEGIDELAMLPAIYHDLRQFTCGKYDEFDLKPGSRSFVRLKQSSPRILVAAAHSRLRSVVSLRILRGSWKDLCNFEPNGKHINMIAPILSNLEALTIEADFYDDCDREVVMGNLQTVLQRAEALQDLFINFGETHGGFWYHLHGEVSPESLPAVSNLGCLLADQPSATLQWPERLRRLSLHNSAGYQHDFYRLFRKLSGLQFLELGDVTLMPHVSQADRDTLLAFPCLVQLLRDIRQRLHLDDVRLCGQWSNTRAQLLTFEQPDNGPACSDSTTTLGKLQNFLTRKTDQCPLDSLAVHPNSKDITREQFEAAACLCDGTFWALDQYFNGALSEDSVSEGLQDNAAGIVGLAGALDADGDSIDSLDAPGSGDDFD